MSVRALYLAVGAAWGIVLGGLVGLAIFVFALGVGGRYVFGNGGWPEFTDWALPAFAVFIGILTFALCVAAGRYVAGRAGSSTAAQHRTRRIGFGMLGLAAAALVGIAVMSVIGVEQKVADEDRREAQAVAFASLSAARHTIDRIDFFGWNADTGSIGIVMRGNRAGDYHISWQVTEPTDGQRLAEGREMVSLGPGRRTVVIPVARDGLIEAYREKVLKGAGGVVVDQPFLLTATVEPALSPKENAVLPPREIQNMAMGRSSLRSNAGVDLPMTFQVPAAPTVQTD